ncbi:helix-turn-helix domain-containing protein [Flavobacterium terrae]|uniref:Cro/C1-type HTH DNA-binding domain-containing protein n=1 Tax=Flavobacterium terrae TaxID=415425 RepID=A0A1M6H8E5_9FLAO|nr:helix-turn-helix transcriptional regulator [Flavobacterium terrae]SHJ18353.1 Cro/C1-type HTH DNA-binding domain-containing protein [Flavobacterium terrae]
MIEVNRKIVDFIANEWVSKAKSQRSFALDHGIDEKTVRSIKNDETYKISLETIIKICEARNLKLSEFFKIIEL